MSTAELSPDPLALTPEQEAIAEVAFKLGAKYADRRFDDHEAAAAQWEDLSSIGFAGLSLPEEHGGAGGMVELCIAAERLAAGGYPAGKLVISTAVAGSIIARNGSPEQRERFLPGLAAGTTRFCFGLTEPGAGSNSMNMRSTAKRRDGVWTLRGEKTYISALESSEVMLAVTQDPEHGGLALFAVPLPDDRIMANRVHVELPVFEYQWSLFLDDVEVPDSALIGEPGRGAHALFDGLNPERLVVAAQAVGMGRWCLERALEHARERVVFDVPIGAHQAVQHPLAEALIALETSWLSVLRAARLYDGGSQAGLESNIAKVAACDAGLAAADAAVQVFGGSGFTDESMMLQRFLYLRLLRTIPVARELALNHIATAGLRLPRSY